MESQKQKKKNQLKSFGNFIKTVNNPVTKNERKAETITDTF